MKKEGVKKGAVGEDVEKWGKHFEKIVRTKGSILQGLKIQGGASVESR